MGGLWPDRTRARRSCQPHRADGVHAEWYTRISLSWVPRDFERPGACGVITRYYAGPAERSYYSYRNSYHIPDAGRLCHSGWLDHRNSMLPHTAFWFTILCQAEGKSIYPYIHIYIANCSCLHVHLDRTCSIPYFKTFLTQFACMCKILCHMSLQ